MPRRLPRFTFKKFIGAKVVNVYSAEEAANVISEAILKAISEAENDPKRLLIISLYTGDEHYECRVWVDQRAVSAVCNYDTPEDLKDIYKIVIEEFETSAIAAAFDMDQCTHLGFTISTAPASNGEAIRELVYTMLGITMPKPMAQTATTPSNGAITTSSSPKILKPVSSKNVAEIVGIKSDDEAMERCISRIWNECATGDCKLPDSIQEALEEDGFIVLGSGSEYLCLLQQDTEYCPYFVIYMGPKKLETYCYKSLSEASWFIDKLKKENNGKFDVVLG